MIKKLMIFSLLFMATLASSQSTERFIRILGNASETFDATGINLNMTIAEVPPNEYRQVRYKSLEDVKAEVEAEFKKLGLSLSSAVENFASNRGNKTLTENYEIKVSEEQAKKILKLGIEGFTANNPKYIFETPEEGYQERLALMAIKDAKRKANAIAKEIGKSVGEILNIEASSANKYKRDEKRSKTSTLKYNVTVTFALND